MSGSKAPPPGTNAAVVRIAFVTAAQAKAAGAALEPDNGGHVTWRVEGTTLVLQASSETGLGLVRTLDDVLGCLRAIGLP